MAAIETDLHKSLDCLLFVDVFPIDEISCEYEPLIERRDGLAGDRLSVPEGHSDSPLVHVEILPEGSAV